MTRSGTMACSTPASFRPGCPPSACCRRRPDSFWRSWRIDLVRDVLGIPAIHARMQNLNGEAIVTVLKDRDPCSLSRASVRRNLARGGGRASDPRRLLGRAGHAAAARIGRDPRLSRRGLGQRPPPPAVDLLGLGRAPPQSQCADGDVAAGRLLMAVGVPPLRGAGVVRPLAEGPRNGRHGRPADPLSDSRRRGLADRRRIGRRRNRS